ncbi:GerPE protein [Fictibacillus macauensis ZFHKF-1]|uniref:GerPE protein n=1 Tax=Fictibacillus macauensis ZFHKF-1 TaxID=1196324 RepID=I8AH04_9BACL|nr:spore germination protein GerPE [Fictibacillus macauensis]EIT84709.1 GerPE protein [Fictibacillus macauensis ZFHKF-1]
MLPRLAQVQHIKLNSVLLSSVVNVGDTGEIRSQARAIALQKFTPTFSQELVKKVDFANYQTFQIPRPQPTQPNGVQMSIENRYPVIEVGSIRIIGMSTCGILHVGNVGEVDLEARVKQIREYESNPDTNSLAIVPFARDASTKEEEE